MSFFLIYMPIGTNKIVFTFIQQVFTKCLPASATGLGSQCFRFNEKGKDSHRTPPPILKGILKTDTMK